MEKNIIIEINRNLELMKVKPLINEASKSDAIVQKLFNSFKNVFLTEKPPMHISFISNFNKLLLKYGRNDSNTLVNSFIFDHKISYNNKLKSISQFFFNNQNYFGFTSNLLEEIIKLIRQNPNSKELFDSIKDSKNQLQAPSEIKQIIKNVFDTYSAGSYLNSDEEFKYLIIYKFLFIAINHNVFQQINYLGNDKFYNFLYKIINDGSDSAINLRKILGYNEKAEVKVTMESLKSNFDLIKNILNAKDVEQEVKNKILLKYLNMNGNNVTDIINSIVELYSKDETFKKNLNYYISNGSNIENVFLELYKNQNIANKINDFNLDASKVEALINYIPYMIKEGGLDTTKILEKTGNAIKNFFSKKSPAYKKINIAHGMLFANQKKLQKTANIEFMRLVVQFDPNKPNYTELRLKAQKLYRGYIMQSGANIRENVLKPLNELRLARGLSEIDKNTLNELISGISNPNETINFYLFFLQKLDKVTYENKYIELLKTLNPFGSRSYDEIPKIEQGKLLEKIKQSIKIRAAKTVKILLFGAQVNLKLLVNCILIFKKNLNVNPKPTIAKKSLIYIQMYLTYLLANYVYNIIFSSVRPILFGFSRYIGILFDETTQRFIEQYVKNYTGLAKDEIQQEIMRGTQTKIASPLLKSIMYETWLMISRDGTLPLKLDETSFGVFVKHIGPNWSNVLLPPVITNFESGLFFRTIVNFYNWQYDTDIKTFKSVLGDFITKIFKELSSFKLGEIEKEGQISNVKTVELTYEVTNTPPTIIVPDFTYDYIKTIEHNGSNIKTYVRKDPTRGIIIYNFGETDANKIVITSTRNTNKYVLKK